MTGSKCGKRIKLDFIDLNFRINKNRTSKLSVECASEGILEIDQYSAKIWTKIWWHVFLRTTYILIKCVIMSLEI